MKYDAEIENWMKTFYESLSPTEQRRYAAVEALKLDGDEDGIAYMVELLGCDPADLDRARQEFVDGAVTAPAAEEADLFSGGLDGVAAGFGEAAETSADEAAEAAGEEDPFAVAVAGMEGEVSPEEANEPSEAAAFWQESGEGTDDGFRLAADDESAAAEGEGDSFGGFESEGAAVESGDVALATSTKRRKQKGPGALGNFLGIVIFGVIGLAAGYGIILGFFPDKDKQMLDLWGRYDTFMNAGTAQVPDEKPVEPNRDFVPGSALTEEEKDADDFVAGDPTGGPRDAADVEANDPEATGEENNPFGGEQDPFGGDNPFGGPTPIDETPLDEAPLDPADEQDDPFAIDVPEIAEFPQPGENLPLDEPQDNGLIAPQGGPTFTIDEVDAAIEEAVGLADDADASFATVYKKLCEVGHRLARSDDEAAAAPRVDAIQTFLAELATDRDKLLGVAQYSDLWLFSGKRPADQKGVVLAGTVTEVENLDGGHRATVQLIKKGGNGPLVTIVSPAVPQYAAGDRLILMGTIITDPATELSNYEGQESPIVLPASSVRL